MPTFRAHYFVDAWTDIPSRIGDQLIEAKDELNALMIAAETKSADEASCRVAEINPAIVEHRPFIGDLYDRGINRKKVSIICYSHYGLSDHAGFSEDVIARFLTGEYQNLQFFWSIMGFFGYTDPEFWRHVMYFNYVPSTIGGDDAKFKHGTPTQMMIAKERFVRLLVQHKPDVALVMTKKPRWAMPDLGYRPFMDPIHDFEKATVKIGPTTVYRLRHPQGAPYNVMRPAVEAILSEQ